MSKTVVAATAAGPDEYYDTLSQTAQDTWDAIASYGWTPQQGDIGFYATENGTETVIGPFPYLGRLLTEVQIQVGQNLLSADGPPPDEGEEPHAADLAADDADDADKETIEREVVDSPDSQDSQDSPDSLQTELTQDAKGNVYLPGTGPIMDQQLADAAGKFHAANTEWKDAGKRRKDAKTELAAICGIKEDLFKPDPDNSNAMIYHAGGLTIRIAEETKETLEVEIEEE